MEHSSWFGYSLSRPFPLRWYTPATITLGIIALFACTMVNFITTGFSMVTTKSSDLRFSLEYHASPVQRNLLRIGYFIAPSLKPLCQPVVIETGDKVSSPYSSLFQYHVNKIRIKDPVTGKNRTDSGFRYFFNQIDSCSMVAGTIEIGGPGQTAQQLSWNAWNPTVRYQFECVITATIEAPFTPEPGLDGTTNYLDLTVEYTYLPPNVHLSDGNATSRGLHRLPIEHIEQKPVLAWGESILTMSWVLLSAKLAELDKQFASFGSQMSSGAISFWRNDHAHDLAYWDYFEYNYQFRSAVTGLLLASDTNTSSNITLLDHTQKSSIWHAVSALAKTFRALVLYDLHVKLDENLLLNRTRMEMYTTDFPQIMDSLFNTNNSASVLTRPGPYTGAYERPAGETSSHNETLMAQLLSKKAYLDVNFNCEVAALRPAFEIIVNVLVQDIVLMGTIYGIWTWVITNYVLGRTKHKKYIDYCEGCMERERNASGDESIVTARGESDAGSFIDRQRSDGGESVRSNACGSSGIASQYSSSGSYLQKTKA